MAILPQLRHWIALPLVFAVLIVAAGLTMRSAPALTAADLSVDAALSHDHTPQLTAIALFINVAFSPPAGVVMIAAICLFLLLARRSPVNAVATGLVAAGSWVSSELFKLVVARHRPDSTALFDPLTPEPGTDSFPSGHTALAVALAIALFLLARGTGWQWPVLAMGALVAVTVALSRVYLGVHYPTDVAASFLTSLTGASFITGLWNKYGLAALARLPFLARLGPVPPPAS
ncbi:phosphatase PAP2 family protein [Arthrobacter globiformis]|uniref:phosphatase PAP2 family protein n=1 Tax=Arthrobacter globiformis TaxID=1665 RepID=UPI0027D925CA|nr:phosphatase PAP2 family protein [Arthrobacter globiformis]